MDPRTGRGALREFRFGQSPDSNRSSSGMPKSGPCRAISVSKLYLPARSHREQAIARLGVWAATSTCVIERFAVARMLLTPIPPPHDGGSRPPLLRRSAQARARPDRHRGQWLSDGREPRPQARFRAVFHPRSWEANAKGARGFERSAIASNASWPSWRATRRVRGQSPLRRPCPAPTQGVTG
jgi:hypothetical protein